MTARTPESVSTCLADWRILVTGDSMPPRNPNNDDDEDDDEDGDAGQMKTSPSSENPTNSRCCHAEISKPSAGRTRLGPGSQVLLV
jgi:hypothetical protein